MGRFPDADMSAMADEGGKKVTPLGLDPVEGEPVDLRDFFNADGTVDAPTPRDAEEANRSFEEMLGADVPEGFADSLDKLFGDEQ